MSVSEGDKDIDFLAINRLNWDERAKVHFEDENDWYGIQGFLAGEDRRTPIDIAGLGDLGGKRVLHSQCHFGLDTLSAARFAESVVGLDFSSVALEYARQLAQQSGLTEKVSFVEANVLEADKHLEPESFDVIYASWGVTGWLDDLSGWARALCRLLKPGGMFFYADAHPTLWLWDQTPRDQGEPLRQAYSYWIDGPIVEDNITSYNESLTACEHTQSVEFMHTLADYFRVFQAQGMQLDDFAEHDAVPWRALPPMQMDPADRQYRLPKGHLNLPLGFSMRWIKPCN